MAAHFVQSTQRQQRVPPLSPGSLRVLHTFRPRASSRAFLERMQPDPETGTSTRRLTRALRDSGVGVEVRSDLDFNDLTRVIEAGFPVIVEVATGTRRLHHWVVLYGDGVAPARVYLAANGWPWVGRRVFTRREFAQLWRPRGKGLICNG